MKETQCQQCENNYPMNQTLIIADHIICENCVEEFIGTQEGITQEMIRANFDPTICVNCQKDSGDVELDILAGAPVCDQCHAFFKNRPFPTWIKVSFAALIAIVLCSFIWNFRFIAAYTQMRRSVQAFARAELEEAAALMTSASEHVPERVELGGFASFYKGLLLIQQDKCAEALPLLRSSQRILGEQYDLSFFITRAEIGIAFDNKDYDKFLSLALTQKKKQPNNPVVLAQAASAYACKYAVTTDEQFKLKALEALEKSRAAPGQDPSFKEYEQRILHRLHSREIITRKEFTERYPEGWTPPEKE